MGFYVNPADPGILKVVRVLHVTNWRDQFDDEGNEIKDQLTSFPAFEDLKVEEGEVICALFHNGNYPFVPVFTDEKEYQRWIEEAKGDGANMLISDVWALPPGTKYRVG